MADYDVIVIGAGPGGYVLALECGRRGLKTVVVEKDKRLGGTCLNVGCIPSKALLESSELHYRLRETGLDHGLVVSDSDVSVDIKKMMARKESVVERLTGGIAALMKARNVEVIHGTATVTGPGTVSVEIGPTAESQKTISAEKVVLATGSRAAELPQLPFDGKRIIDSTDALALKTIPKSMAVIGAGAVGLEIGSVWSRLGTKTTVIEALPRVVPGGDSQASRVLAAALKRQGMTILSGKILVSAEVSSRRAVLVLNDAEDSKKSGEETERDLSIDVEKVLVAVGRKANLDSALAPSIQPERSPDGRFLKVDTNFETSIQGLFAIGDLIGNPMLAHKAEEDAMALAGVLAGEPHPPWGGPIPNIVYTEPELAWAGSTEDQLKAAGTPYEKGQFPFAANGRALASGSEDGFVKLLSSPGDRKLLGAVIVGRGASELIAEAVSVMAMGGSAEDIALTVHGHPTMSEAVKEAALALIGRPLHRS